MAHHDLLPRELYHSILQYLPIEDLFRSANFVCHEFYQIIHCDATFQKALYLNNFTRDFVMIGNCYFDEEVNSCILEMELKFPKEQTVQINIMKELKLIKNPFKWDNIISYGLERPLILMRFYNDQEMFELRDDLVEEIFTQSADKECTALFCEMCKLYEYIQQTSLTNEANIFNLKDSRGTVLMKMAFANCDEKFIWMCENLKAPLSKKPNTKLQYLQITNKTYGQNCLHIACSRGSMSIVKYLVETKGMDVGIADSDGYTCLHLAASKSNLDLCKYLIEHGANKHILTLNGFRPINLVRVDNQELKKLLQVQAIRN